MRASADYLDVALLVVEVRADVPAGNLDRTLPPAPVDEAAITAPTERWDIGSPLGRADAYQAASERPFDRAGVGMTSALLSLLLLVTKLVFLGV